MEDKEKIKFRNLFIADLKWLYSEQEGRDIGVIKTIDKYLAEHGKINGEKDRKKLVLDYLLNRNIKDDNGCCSLEGELKRCWARQIGISPEDVKKDELDFTLLVNYLYESSLGSLLQTLNAEIKNIIYPFKPFWSRR